MFATNQQRIFLLGISTWLLYSMPCSSSFAAQTSTKEASSRLLKKTRHGESKLPKASYQGRPQEAIADYSSALKPNSGSHKAEHYFDRGLIYEDSDKHRLAIDDFSAAIELKPADASYYMHRGNSYFGVSDFKRAISDYTRCLELNKENAEAFFRRAQAYEEVGQRELALSDFDHAIELQPDKSARYYVKRAVLRAFLGNHEGAVSDISKALAETQSDAEIFYDRGLEYAAIGKYKESVEDLTQCVALQPDFACAYKNRALAHEHLGDYQAAILDLEQSDKLYKTDGDRHGCAEVERLIGRLKRDKISAQ